MLGKKPLGNIKKKKNEAACGIHTASSSLLGEESRRRQKRRETRWRVVFTPPRCLRRGRKPLGNIKRKRNETACGIHTASSSFLWDESPRGP